MRALVSHQCGPGSRGSGGAGFCGAVVKPSPLSWCLFFSFSFPLVIFRLSPLFLQVLIYIFSICLSLKLGEDRRGAYLFSWLCSLSLDPQQDLSYWYQLIGVVVHTGTAEGGHYYSFIRDRSSPQGRDQWFLFNDAEVKPFDPAQIGSECFGGEMTVSSRTACQVACENTRHFATSPLVSIKTTSEERAQKFHADDVSLPRSG